MAPAPDLRGPGQFAPWAPIPTSQIGHHLPLAELRWSRAQEHVDPHPLTSSEVGLDALRSHLCRHHGDSRELGVFCYLISDVMSS